MNSRPLASLACSGPLLAFTLGAGGLLSGCGEPEPSLMQATTGAAASSPGAPAAGSGTTNPAGSQTGGQATTGAPTGSATPSATSSGAGQAPGATETGVTTPESGAGSGQEPPGTTGTSDTSVETPPEGSTETPVEDGSGVTPVEDGNLLVDDFEDGDAVVMDHGGLAGRWGTYNDGTGTQTPAAGSAMSAEPGGANGSAYAAFTSGSGFADWGAGLQVDLNNSGSRLPFDATPFAGVSFFAKGSGSVRVELVTMAITEPSGGGTCETGCYDAHGFSIELGADWQEHVIPFSSLAQEDWGTAAAFAPAELLGINFKVAPADTFELWVDELMFLETASGGAGDDGAADDGAADDGAGEVEVPEEPEELVPTSTPGMCSMDIGRYDGNGSVTFYTFDMGSAEVNCGFQITGRNPDTVANIYTGEGRYFGAMNTTDYNTAAMCGACVEVTRDGGRSVVITVVDRCPVETNPKCQRGHIDLSREAFRQLGNDSEGHLGTGNGGAVGSISWRYVECPVGNNNVKYRLKEPNNNGWNELLVQGHRFPISSVEIDGKVATRKEYNYWEPAGNMGSGPWDIKVTDVVGSTIESTVERGDGDLDSGLQFSCQ